MHCLCGQVEASASKSVCVCVGNGDIWQGGSRSITPLTRYEIVPLVNLICLLWKLREVRAELVVVAFSIFEYGLSKKSAVLEWWQKLSRWKMLCALH